MSWDITRQECSLLSPWVHSRRRVEDLYQESLSPKERLINLLRCRDSVCNRSTPFFWNSLQRPETWEHHDHLKRAHQAHRLWVLESNRREWMSHNSLWDCRLYGSWDHSQDAIWVGGWYLDIWYSSVWNDRRVYSFSWLRWRNHVSENHSSRYQLAQEHRQNLQRPYLEDPCHRPGNVNIN